MANEKNLFETFRTFFLGIDEIFPLLKLKKKSGIAVKQFLFVFFVGKRKIF